MSTLHINDNGVNRPMTAEEQTEFEKNAAIMLAEEQARQQAAADAFEARKAPLRRLGLTEDEINTVLGL